MRTRVLWLGVVGLLTGPGCGGSTPQGASAQEGAPPPAPSHDAATPGEAQPQPVNGGATGAPSIGAAGGLRREEAEQYVLALINRDRAAHGLPKVGWDETAAAAGRRHAADMAAHGVTAHLGTDGSVPEQRYTDVGGVGMVMENAGCFADGITREIDPAPIFRREGLERIERAFMSEVPPSDGHKRNILTRNHNAVGVGLALTKGLDIPCMAQEFIDDYGEYAPVPRKAKLGASIQASGRLREPVKIAGVGFSRVPLRKPMPAAELMKTGGYMIPAPYTMFFPAGFQTKVVLNVDKASNSFSVTAPMSDGNKPGLYGVSVWATFPGSKDLVMVSLRTIYVD